MTNYTIAKNNERIPLSSIPETDYELFMETNVSLLNEPQNHCVNYFGYPENDKIKLICCIADDSDHSIYISSSVVDKDKTYPSFTAIHLAFEKFEREIHENFGIQYADHPWLKSVRYAFNRADMGKTMNNYPFYEIESEELHEVGVGPIHAGVIEPGHFRFICNGEQILHLEIQLGYQHRGVESLFLEKKKLLQRATLAESIAGDTVVGHSTAFAHLWESLSDFSVNDNLEFDRVLALELERIAIHTGDLSALCTDIAYQLGSSVYGRLRTPIVNYFQEWCGNRLAKSLIRPGKTNFPYTKTLANRLQTIFDTYEPDFREITNKMLNLPSALARFEKTGIVTTEQAATIGTVGMSARMSGICRDIRWSHPFGLYTTINHQPEMHHGGDVKRRVLIRIEEIYQSMNYIRNMIQYVPDRNTENIKDLTPMADSFAISLVEGWRGEICHCAITGHDGELVHYKIKDPSHHNWLALALAVRNNEISDFPICNKSFDLSYCGSDL